MTLASRLEPGQHGQPRENELNDGLEFFEPAPYVRRMTGRERVVGRLALASVAVYLAGCPVAGDEPRYASASTSMAIERTHPAEGGVLRPGESIDLCWSTEVDPRSLIDSSVIISSGQSRSDVRSRVQLFPWLGPGGNEATERWCEGSVLSIQPTTQLLSGVRYRLRIDARLVGWRGETPSTTDAGWTLTDDGAPVFFLEFSIGDEVTGNEVALAAPPTLQTLFTGGHVLDPERGMCSCHLDPDDLALQRLDLRDPETASRWLLDPRVRETGFPMVTPREPSESYLLHKLLHEPHGEALFGVRGDPMPPGEDELEYEDLVEVARWIDAGVPL